MSTAPASAARSLPVELGVQQSKVRTGTKLIVQVRAAYGSVCDAQIRAAGKRQALPALVTERDGKGAWSAFVPPRAPGGTWQFATSCSRDREGSASQRLKVRVKRPDRRADLIYNGTGNITKSQREGLGASLGNSYPYGQCTWYAFQRRAEAGNPLPPLFGNAKDWIRAAADRGIPTGKDPAVGAVVVLQPGVQFASAAYGHVAFVDEVEPGRFRVAEMNVRGVGVVSSRWISSQRVNGMDFIYGGGVNPAAPQQSQEPPGPNFNGGKSWFARLSNTSGASEINFDFGVAGDVPFVSDWDGDGQSEPGVFRNGHWFLRTSNTSGGADLAFDFGNSGDRALLGQVDSDPEQEPCVFRATNSRFYCRLSLSTGSSEFDFGFGAPGDLPALGDIDSDGQSEPCLFRGSNGTWYCRNSNTSGGADLSFQFGGKGDAPLLAQVDDDPGLEPCLWRPSSGQWFCRRGLSSGASEFDFAFGGSRDVALMGDVDSDGQAEPIVNRP